MTVCPPSSPNRNVSRPRPRSRSPPGCGRGRSTSSSARSTFSARASCCGGCSQADRLQSVIFYGPPGTGKTALAQVIAEHTKAGSASSTPSSAGVKEVREVLAEARDAARTRRRADDAVRRRNAPLQPDPAGRAAAGRGRRRRHPDRGDDRRTRSSRSSRPLVSRSQIFEFEPLSTRTTSDSSCERALARHRTRPRRHRVDGHRRGARRSWPKSATATPGGR